MDQIRYARALLPQVIMPFSSQVGELSILESSARNECLRLQQQVASLSASQERLQTHLTTSRERELQYEMRFSLEGANGGGIATSVGSSAAVRAVSSSSGGSSSSKVDIRPASPASNGLLGHPLLSSELDTSETHEEKSGETSGDKEEKVGDPPHLLVISALTLRQAQERAKETQVELDEARANLNDLILEIESVSVEESRSREQSVRVLRQMTDR
jgi:hypothetical protein